MRLRRKSGFTKRSWMFMTVAPAPFPDQLENWSMVVANATGVFESSVKGALWMHAK